MISSSPSLIRGNFWCDYAGEDNELTTRQDARIRELEARLAQRGEETRKALAEAAQLAQQAYQTRLTVAEEGNKELYPYQATILGVFEIDNERKLNEMTQAHELELNALKRKVAVRGSSLTFRPWLFLILSLLDRLPMKHYRMSKHEVVMY